MATSAAGHFHSRPFFILERESHNRFLIDTGTKVSVLPPTKKDKLQHQQGLDLQATNGTAIST